mmetsp:Transcript_5139/g.10848  ORF Transcript_5139/g.10848 Transcript_5139/m.10848 type:complete len:1069 (-) Transcript_5139:172-3378(-)
MDSTKPTIALPLQLQPLNTVQQKHEGKKGKQQQNKRGGPSLVAPPSRRSGRARRSTTMQINGQTVLRKNNYTVTASSYIFDVCSEDDYDDKKNRPAKKTKIDLPQDRAVRKATPAQVERQRHNQAVMDSVRQKQVLRNRFFARGADILQPFCEPRVLKNLKSKTSLPATEIQPLSVAQPKMIEATLRDYQLRGLNFMIHMHRQNLAMILGDEMGLGKTLQTISLLCYLKEQENVTGPSLVICPLSVLSSWCNEMQKWSPTLKYFRLHASDSKEQARQKEILKDHATEYDIILTTYEMAKVPTLHSLYNRLHFNYLVLDEGHKIKGHETIIAQTARKIHAGNKLLLTGTPLQNNLVELWSLLNFLYPDIFTTMDPFKKHFNLNENVVDKKFLVKTQKLLEIFMLRRLKSEVEKLIPEKLETKVYCPLSKTQTFWYKALLMKDVSSLSRMEGEGELSGSRYSLLRSLFMQLRKCCNHPFLFNGAETDPDETSLKELMASSGKLSVLDMLLQSLCKKGHRVVLFSQFTMLLDLLEDYCILRGWKYCRLDGGTDRARRSYLINRFNEPDSAYFVFLVSTRSGGMGLNLQSADTCILFDSDWNPQCDIQAMGRVHRIGQSKKVHVYRLVSSGTIEERMLERAEKKLLLEMVNRKSNNEAINSDDVARGLTARELLEDLKFGCEAIFGSSANKELPSWEDIDIITDRSRKESDSIGNLEGGTSKNAHSFDAEKEFSSTACFEGTNFQDIRKKVEMEKKQDIPKNLANIAYLWKEIKSLDTKRIKKSRIIQVDGKGSGYGSSVPVLCSNNYELQNGESSVFDRELSNKKKSNFEVKKMKKSAEYEHQDFCQICGDGGDLVCCPRCPCSVHLECMGLSDSKEFQHCPHHRCYECSKNRASAGGLLFPCQSCPRAYCEDCLPKTGVTFLDKNNHFEELGFDSTKNVVYIHCSEICENYAKQEHGYAIPPKSQQHCPEHLDLSYNFGASCDLDINPEVDAEKDCSLSKGIHTCSKGIHTSNSADYVSQNRIDGHITPEYLEELGITAIIPSSAFHSSVKNTRKLSTGDTSDSPISISD